MPMKAGGTGAVVDPPEPQDTHDRDDTVSDGKE
jgi:hypothetical protein